MRKNIIIICCLIVNFALGATITYFYFYNKVFQEGFEEGKDWAIQMILDYDSTPIICDEDCEIS